MADNKLKEKVITLGELKVFAECYTYMVRNNPNHRDFVKTIDDFIMRVENYVNDCDEDDNEY